MNEATCIREMLMQIARGRRDGCTFCPSEAARRLSKDWRPLMSQVREVAAELVGQGELVCTQRGEPAHPLQTKGAIRLAEVRTECSKTQA